jgi:hypothetical protein
MYGMKVTFGTRLQVHEVYVKKLSTSARIIWQLDNPLYCHIYDDKIDRVIEVIVPKDFYTDFCSVPRIPFAYLLYGGIANRAGALHDALYSEWTAIVARDLYTREVFEITREWADLVLEAAVIACSAPAWKAKMMYWGVRLKGGDYYRKPAVYSHGVANYDPY